MTLMTPKSIISRSLLASAFAAVLAFSTTTAHAQIPQDSLVAHFAFENNFEDSAGSSPSQNMGALFQSNTPFRNTPFSIESTASAFFSSNDDFVRINDGILDDYGEDYTAAAWFKADRAPSGLPGTADEERFVVFESENFLISLGLREDPGNTENTLVQFFTNTTATSDPRINILVLDSLIVDDWVHAAVVYDASVGSRGELRAYLNGVLQQTLTLTEPLDLTTPPSFFNIGTFRGANGRFFEGNIDDVAIWDRALGSGEIFAIFRPRFDVNRDETVSVADLAQVRSAILANSTAEENDVLPSGNVEESDPLVNEADANFLEIFLFPTTGGVGAERRLVRNLSDDPSNDDSLRAILANAQTGANGGTLVSFDETLDGGTLTLSNGQLEVLSGRDVFLDASNLPNGLTIDAGGQSRVMMIEENATVSLHGLTLTGGRAPNGQDGEDGAGGKATAATAKTAAEFLFLPTPPSVSPPAPSTTIKLATATAATAASAATAATAAESLSILMARSRSPPPPSVATKLATAASAAEAAAEAAPAAESLPILMARSRSPPPPSVATKPATAATAATAAAATAAATAAD